MAEIDLWNARRILQYATVILGAFWMALISIAWIQYPTAIGTFMFQFLHATSFILLIQDTEIVLRAGVTGFFLLTDTLTLILRCVAPVLPAWSAVHICAVIHSALVLILAWAQVYVVWYPFFFKNKRKPLIT